MRLYLLDDVSPHIDFIELIDLGDGSYQVDQCRSAELIVDLNEQMDGLDEHLDHWVLAVFKVYVDEIHAFMVH